MSKRQRPTDPLFMQIAQRSGSLPVLLEEFFSFLHRSTDFYVVGDVEEFRKKTATMGFPPGEAERLLLDAFKKFPMKKLKVRDDM
mmetsp:Transcript_20654/g.43038  ORF Transcript_20654/g.43038 Transcript_20654/m.43038 type:complete len:85 (-) Transcript_20654:90-344(-)|eukprot:CAMPEP_0197557752 /NCGR_PEP_ID=MMETSP1320-20131121/17691_1 /TAXON_ID=91990 /ORGANISM="Bolidomonas sp., Strain RCC2347" /LENGTH=84 /DNA_ID=CAMNT_0043119009 /DNA_START=133 /DNA_END=387 /DNA_ORIENTATION=+